MFDDPLSSLDVPAFLKQGRAKTARATATVKRRKQIWMNVTEEARRRLAELV